MASEAASTGFDVARLVKEHQAGVWRFLRVLGCDPAEADDLTQETFLAVLQKPFQDYNRTATSAYLRQVARNLFVDSRRRASRTVTATDISTANLDELEATWVRWHSGRGGRYSGTGGRYSGTGGDAGQHQDDGAELLQTLQHCLQTLTERARQALDLRFRDRLPRVEIAAKLGMSEDGAKNLMQRAKQQLRTCIERSMK
ncbi:MAG TPA: sigma-70 family RNA polymerase sigma factor [Pirellulales bacterium]|nr:sigma-70 family RNA polymerase sigma factor [Pirellulales bacterium]